MVEAPVGKFVVAVVREQAREPAKGGRVAEGGQVGRVGVRVVWGSACAWRRRGVDGGKAIPLFGKWLEVDVVVVGPLFGRGVVGAGGCGGSVRRAGQMGGGGKG